MFRNESIYIAGPECFYKNGTKLLAAMRQKAEALGFGVTLPNDNPLKLDHEDLQVNAQSIFEDLKIDINESTIIIADLEAFRGTEPDSGTIYEIGMAYARGLRCYGYTRDKRTIAEKHPALILKNGLLTDQKGENVPYTDLPFAPAVTGSTKIIEGDFDDCLKAVIADLEESYKAAGWAEEDILSHVHSGETKEKPGSSDANQPLVLLSGPERYNKDSQALYSMMKEICQKYGYQAITPTEGLDLEAVSLIQNPYQRAGIIFDNYQRQVKKCDLLIADLNDFRGYEPSNDTAFECGMAFQLGKPLYGYMDSTIPMIQRIPHLGSTNEYRDQTGSNVENFNYPINLMFACSMPIFAGTFETTASQIFEHYEKGQKNLK